MALQDVLSATATPLFTREFVSQSTYSGKWSNTTNACLLLEPNDGRNNNRQVSLHA